MNVAVRRSRRARRARIQVLGPGRVEVVLPLRAPASTADRLLRAHAGWLEQALAREAARPRLGLDGAVWLHGERVDAPGTERWYRERARAAVHSALGREAPRIGVSFSRVRIADQKTRWGSCSTRGTLSFSWRLVVPPRPVLDYVVVHELCHLRHPNHSRAFWAELERWMPGWREPAAWLKRHGRELAEYAPGEASGGGSRR